MEKIFGRVRQGVSKYRKRLVYGALALFIGQLCFLGIGGIGNRVFAEESQQTADEKVELKLEEWNKSLKVVVDVVNVLIYPILILVGKLVDNSLVYGKVFGFDAVLWHLWNIVKNLANYTLGFIFVYKIFRYLINGKEKVKDIILRSLIAGIGIQASWFLMGALIDLSTILTYGVGGLPISVLGDVTDDELKDTMNPYVLKTIVNINLEDGTDYRYLTNTTGDFYISECETFTYNYLSGQKEELILAPRMIYYEVSSGSFKPTDAYRCHYYGQVYYFNKLLGDIENDSEGKFPGLGAPATIGGVKVFNDCSPNCASKQADYVAVLTNVRGDLNRPEKKDDVGISIAVASLLEIGNAHVTGGIYGSLFDVELYSSDQHFGLDVDNKWTGSGGNVVRLNDILHDKSYAGVFSALYSSLLDLGNNTVNKFSSAKGLFVDVVNTAFSVLYILAISIPLLVVALVFMMRIGIIWVAISVSPFIVLFTAFELFKSDSIKKIKFLDYFTLETLIPIIFSPAIICFAISMSAVLFIIITNMNVELSTIAQDIEGGLFKVEIAGSGVRISQLVLLVLGVAVTWFIVWASVEASKLGESTIIKNIKDLTNSSLGALPIIPVPTKNGTEMMGVSTVFGGNDQQGLISRMGNKLKDQYNQRSNEAIDMLINPEKATNKPKIDEFAAYKKELFASSSITENWTTMSIPVGDGKNPSFNQLTPEQQKSVIEEINSITDENKRVKFKTTSPITIGDDTRKFDDQDKKFKNEKSNPVSQGQS